MMAVLGALGWLLLTLLKIVGILLLIVLVLLALALLCPFCADFCWENGVVTIRAGVPGITLPVFRCPASPSALHPQAPTLTARTPPTRTCSAAAAVRASTSSRWLFWW